MLELRIPPSRRERNPLLSEAGWQMFRYIHGHPDAPRWNYEVGDRLLARDIPGVASFRKQIAAQRPQFSEGPPEWLISWVERLRDRVPLFRQRLPEGFHIRRDWHYIDTLSREDIAQHIERLVPLDADLSRLIVYETNGTSTGHSLDVPNHPAAVALNHPLLEYALAQHQVFPAFNDRQVACINVGAEARTVIFPNVFAVWNNAGFAKVNLHASTWEPERARRFFASLAPEFLTGDPVAFNELARWGIDYRPKAMVSTATILSGELKTQLEVKYGCPLIDFYSTTETGPIAYANPEGNGFSQLAPDIHIEILDDDGFPVPPGALGEITLSGGRNPFLPLLRYRTGDFARLQPKGTRLDPAPRLLDLHAREPVLFRAASGALVHPLDIAYALRTQLWVQHELHQRVDRSLTLRIRPGLGSRIDREALHEELAQLFGKLPIEISEDPHLGENRPGGKMIAYRSEISPTF